MKNIKFPIKIKGLDFPNDSIPSDQYRSQMKALPSCRFYMDGVIHTDHGFFFSINSFNLLSIELFSNDIEADVREGDFFMEKGGKLVKVTTVDRTHNKIILSDKGEANNAGLLNGYEWYPAYIQRKDNRFRQFYYGLYGLILSDKASAEVQGQLSSLKGILNKEERIKALEWLNIGDGEFKDFLSENGVI